MKQIAATSFIILFAVSSISLDINAQPNEISYEIGATLDPITKTVSGTEFIHFQNGTGQALDTLYIYLYPNRFKPGSLVALYEDYEDFDTFFPDGPDWGWLEVTDFRIDGVEAAYDVEEILMSVPLTQPMTTGAEITLEISFELQLPNSFRRLGYQDSNHFMSWWYPQMARHDGERWHTDLMVGYSSAEPYQDFASYDVNLTVPSDFVVGATGSLQSEQNLGEIKELHYKAENVHDFAWVADPNYAKDEFDCNGITIHSLYQPKYAKTAQPMAETACDIINYLSERFGQYPYEQFTIAQAGLIFGAMEYPQLIMNGDIFYRFPTHIRYGDMVTAHEVAHQWFYGLLMSNQTAETWLDEGFAEFSTIAYMEDRYGTDENLFDKEFIANAFTDLLVDPYIGIFSSLLGDDSVRNLTLNEYIATAKRGTEAPLLTHSGEVPLGKSILPYQKGALTLLALEEYLGRETFDQVMQTYFDRFHFGHPTTNDFIAIAEEISGEGLDWFFDAWLRSTEQIDFAVTALDRQDTRTVIKLRNNQSLRMPVDVEIQFKGDAEPIVKHWENISETGEVVYEGDLEVKNVLIDPDKTYPDINRINNKIHSPIEFEPYFTHGMLQGYPDDGLLLGATIAAVGQDLNVTGFYVWNRKKIGWDVNGSQNFQFGGRKTSEISAHARDDSHTVSANAEVELNWFTPLSFILRSTHTITARTFFQNRYDVAEDMGLSTGATLSYFLQLTDQRARFIELKLEHTRNLPSSEYDFEKYSAELQINQRVAWMTYLNLRLFAGQKVGAEPVDGDFNLQQHGLFRTFDRQSDLLLAANLDLRFPLPKLNYIDLGFFPLPFSAAGIIFADGALFPNESNDMRAEAGIGLTLGPFGARDMLRFEYPLWVNTPADSGVKEFRFRVGVDF